MSAVAADTHSIVWYLDDDSRLSSRAKAALDGALAAGEHIHISGITCIELAFLVDKGRIKADLLTRLFGWLESTSSGLVEVPVGRHILSHLQRIPRNVVPDMPDRIIAATALSLGLPLVTRDGEIRCSDIVTIW